MQASDYLLWRLSTFVGNISTMRAAWGILIRISIITANKTGLGFA